MSNEDMVDRLRDRWLDPPPDPEPICRCDACGEGIYEGERAWIILDETFCDDCAKNIYSQILHSD